MSLRLATLLTVCALALVLASGMFAAQSATPALGAASDLRLVPFPKQARLEPGLFAIGPTMSLTVTDVAVARQATDDLQKELLRAAKSKCRVSLVATKQGLPTFWLLLSPSRSIPATLKTDLSSAPTQSEGYRLVVRKGYAAVGARSTAGLVWGAQALLQLVRANMQGSSLPCLTIDDWPSLQYRGFMDDITRGPSPTIGTLELEARMSALLKMNIQNYYIEHQYAFKKYPDIGPAEGSLKPGELKELVAYAKARNVEIIGNQQSFGHWATILRNPKYAHLGETWWVLNPLLEETYQMLDDMYAEQIPLTESGFFNVDCDETGGLGTRATKELADKIGVGGVYAMHITRLHDMLRDKYHKRMMMWGDIILRHPENLKDIPKDTMMLTWNYSDQVSYDDEVVPFEKAGFDYMVCPTTTCWSVLPDFGFAVDNIQGFVRDGVAHGTKGVLNTTWDDDDEAFFAYFWHGIAWGSECAWNGSATSIDDFNRRIGPVLFGDKDNHFGKAITILSRTHKGHIDISTHRFWRTAALPAPADREAAALKAKELLDVVEPALVELKLARKDATVNADQLDYLIFGAERMKHMATRTLALLDAADCYAKASAGSPEAAEPLLKTAIQDAKGTRDECIGLKWQYRLLWLREEKPYTLDRALRRYDRLVTGYDKIIAGLESASAAAREKRALPAADAIWVADPAPRRQGQ